MKTPDRKVVGQRIKNLRGDRSRTEVAKALGVTTMAIYRYETGERTPPDAMKVAMAEYFGRSVESIFFSKE